MVFDLATELTGISGILVSPFDGDDRLVPDRLEPIIDRAIGAGVHCLTVNGNTGEYYGLTGQEADRMVQSVTEMVAGRVPVIGGVGRSVNEACALARTSVRAGVSALMIHQPPDPFVSPRGLETYISRIAEAVPDAPLVLYLRNDGVGLDCIERICAIEGVVGVKWATTNAAMLARAIRVAHEDIVWVAGLAEVWAPPLYAVGARGFTSGLINVWPEKSVEIHAALEAGDYCLADHLIGDMAGFEDVRAEELGGANVTGVKAALQMTGHDCGAVRPPSAWPPTQDQTTRLRAFLREARLLEE